ncbi:MAG: PilZ domain-containing protein [Synechococcaceae cyanobacterium]|nr:PilZ domain-containing protein [Synechococcaceae cyanobacterium]
MRRRETRFPTPYLDIVIRVEIFYQNRRYVCMLWDVSPGGCCLRMRTALPIGEALRLVICSPNGEETIETTGRLQWINPLGEMHYAGLVFDERVDFSQTFLRQLMHQ